ncbi:MAG: AAA family ATPase, partial [Selenomonadaceae bacterium]|nr:AAA family ATPase [Selenomonadaceae bacterium]
MLKTLTVENFALIENVTVEFGGGLNILTGETGAGKSILIEALGAILGNRLGASKIRKGADYLRVEAIFSDGLKITRKVSRTGKNSIAAGGKLITLAQLKKIGEQLLDMHDQNKNLELLREENIYALTDDEKISEELKIFRRLYRELNSKISSLEKKLSARAENLERLDFLRWQAREISAVNLKPDEDEKLEAEIKKLSHAEKIAEHIQESVQLLNDGDSDVLSALVRVAKNLDDVARYDNKLDSARKLLEEAEFSLREAYEEIRGYGGGLEFSTERLDELQARADEISKLKQKYGASVNEILKRLEKIRGDIEAAENFDSDVEEL